MLAHDRSFEAFPFGTLLKIGFGVGPVARFSLTIVDHAASPRNRRVMEQADRVGIAGTPGRGAFVVLYLRIHEGTVCEATFQSNGCGPTIACSSVITDHIAGKPLAVLHEIDERKILDLVGGLPPDKRHCSSLVHQAIRDVIARDGRP